MEYLHHITSPVGKLTVTGDGENLSGLWIQGQKYFAQTADPGAVRQKLPLFESVEKWLAVYFSGREPDFMPPLLPRGTPFQTAVWRLLCAIPYGQTASYGELAKRFEREHRRPTSPRAVGGAVGRNPVSILIPCHRVLGGGGALTGYAGGIEKKRRLLQLEGAAVKPKEAAFP
jgi:methylated-DNA-[protein]-cysteine S-methyltransferase